MFPLFVAPGVVLKEMERIIKDFFWATTEEKKKFYLRVMKKL